MISTVYKPEIQSRPRSWCASSLPSCPMMLSSILPQPLLNSHIQISSFPGTKWPWFYISHSLLPLMFIAPHSTIPTLTVLRSPIHPSYHFLHSHYILFTQLLWSMITITLLHKSVATLTFSHSYSLGKTNTFLNPDLTLPPYLPTSISSYNFMSSHVTINDPFIL